MFARIALVIAAAALTALGLLALRQDRLRIEHDVAQAHRQVNQTRQSLWDLQCRIAQHVQPAAIREAAARQGLNLEPLMLTASPVEPRPQPPAVRVAQRTPPRRSRGN